MTRLEVIETLDYLREHSISHVYAECLDIAARAICQNCGTATKIYKISEAFCTDGGRLATSITSKGIIRSIYNALKEWQGLSAE